MLYIIQALVTLLLSSCYNKDSSYTEETDSIIFIYSTGHIDYPTQRKYNMLYRNTDKRKNDSIIYINKTIYNDLKKKIATKNLVPKSRNCTASQYIKNDSVELFLDEFNSCCNRQEEYIHLDLNLIYKIRCITGYYNYFPPDHLLWHNEVKQFGIPTHYKPTNYEKGTAIIKRKASLKVVIKPQP